MLARAAQGNGHAGPRRGEGQRLHDAVHVQLFVRGNKEEQVQGAQRIRQGLPCSSHVQERLQGSQADQPLHGILRPSGAAFWRSPLGPYRQTAGRNAGEQVSHFGDGVHGELQLPRLLTRLAKGNSPLGSLERVQLARRLGQEVGHLSQQAQREEGVAEDSIFQQDQ